MSGFEHPSYVTGQARLLKPADPTKPLSETQRRILQAVAAGGTLRKTRRRDPIPGRRHLPHPDPSMYFYMLIRTREKGDSIGRIGRDRRVMKGTVQALQDKGVLARNFAAGPEEATREDVTPLGWKLLEQTDEHGNWLKEEV